ncbi:hypothetical protein GCM10010430_04880 [Kitasatospora cystarginea]|uniref:Uncharacterized protein n=1 Tax=Kitasatospora cystarginea TaxID=58350 RepID=A0ABP5QAC7_9ACTN
MASRASPSRVCDLGLAEGVAEALEQLQRLLVQVKRLGKAAELVLDRPEMP